MLSVDTTPMTKCFKPILLEAFLELGGFKQPPTTQRLAECNLILLSRYPQLFSSKLPTKQ